MEGRARFALWAWLRQYESGSAIAEHRMRRVLAETDASEVDELLEDFAAIDAEVARIRNYGNGSPTQGN